MRPPRRRRPVDDVAPTGHVTYRPYPFSDEIICENFIDEPAKFKASAFTHFGRFFRTLLQDFAISFRSAKKFYNFKTSV